MSRVFSCLPLLVTIVLSGGLSSGAVQVVSAEIVLPERPPLSDEVKALLQAASNDPALAPWQSEFMRGLARGPGLSPSSLDGEWSEMVAPTRAEATAIYDPVRDRILIFGGYDQSRYRNEVLVLSLAGTPAWSQLAPAGSPPDARIGHRAIYDPVRDRMIIFGGIGYDGASYSRRNDTWALSLAGTPAWSQLAPAGPLPAARDSHTAIYDPVRDRMLMFGGFAPPSTYMNDTWSLSLAGSSTWSQLTPAGSPPTVRYGHTAMYDAARDRMLIFGGQDVVSLRNDTWSLSLAGTVAWSQVTTGGSSPLARIYPTAIYDPVRDRMLIFGGITTAIAFANDTWALSLAGTPTWSQLAPAGSRPRARWLHAAIYDPVRDRMVISGGQEASGSFRGTLNDTWALSLPGASPAWNPLPPALPPAAAYPAAIYDSIRDRIVIFGGYDGTSYRNDTWTLSLAGTPTWSQLTPAGSPPGARWGHTAIYDPVNDRMLIFGGYDGLVLRNDTWTLSFAGTPTWSQLTSGFPSARAYHSAIYDPMREEMLVFGGITTSGFQNDTWTLSLAATPVWTQLTAGGPAARSGHAAIYDPVRDRMVIFGGYDGTSARSDTWAFARAGTAWSQLTSGGPAARFNHTAIYDPLRDRMVIFGGYNGTIYANDTWAFALGGSPAWSQLAPGGDSLPLARRYHSATYDPVRDRMVMLGGYDGSTYRGDTWTLTWGETTEVTAPPAWVGATGIQGIAPNPSNALQQFDLALAAGDRPLALGIYDVQGRLVWSRDLRHLGPGAHALSWAGEDKTGRIAAAGTYFAVLETLSGKACRKVIRIR